MRAVKSTLALVLMLLLVSAGAVSGHTTSAVAALANATCSPQKSIDRAVAYTRTQQQPDGSFPSIGQTSTAEATYALAAAGVDPSTVTQGGKSPIDWIYGHTGDIASTGAAAKFLLALAVAKRSTVAPNGYDFVARVERGYDPVTGLYDADPTGNGYVLLTLRAAGRPVPGKALDAWAAQQQPDGGWSAYRPAKGTDTNTTALAIVALAVHGRSGPVPRALAYLRGQQSPDGGFPFSADLGTASDANSTALVTLALLAARQDLGDWERSGVDPLQRLLQLQNPSGAFRYSDEIPADNAFATFQAGQAIGLTRCHR